EQRRQADAAGPTGTRRRARWDGPVRDRHVRGTHLDRDGHLLHARQHAVVERAVGLDLAREDRVLDAGILLLERLRLLLFEARAETLLLVARGAVVAPDGLAHARDLGVDVAPDRVGLALELGDAPVAGLELRGHARVLAVGHGELDLQLVEGRVLRQIG